MLALTKNTHTHTHTHKHTSQCTHTRREASIVQKRAALRSTARGFGVGGKRRRRAGRALCLVDLRRGDRVLGVRLERAVELLHRRVEGRRRERADAVKEPT
eukprot:4864388-Pleurochrysis_carterae.AAC.1